MEQLDKNEKIKIFFQSTEYLIFDVQSLLICEKINLKIALIGPCPRQLTSDKSSIPGLINKFQLRILIDHFLPNLLFFDSDSPLTDPEHDQKRKNNILNEIDQKVSLVHAQKAELYSKRKSEIVKSNIPRWNINFTSDFSSRREIRAPEPNSIFESKLENELYLVYKHFWHAGFWFTSGLKYGVDWLAYNGSPEIFHSMYLVKYVDINEPISTSQMSHLCRLGSKTKKKLVLASISGPGKTVITSQVAWSNRAQMSHQIQQIDD